MKVALVYDHLNKIGGAEVVLQSLAEIYPQADWYTSVWDPQRAPFSKSWQVHPVITWLHRHHELIPFLMPFIFESIDLSSYDLVISIGAMAKGVITRADTLHINYCLTPTRYLWSHADFYLHHPQFGWFQRLSTPLIKFVFRYLRQWDLTASTRPDIMISISEHVKKRVKKYYNRSTSVIYPPVNLAHSYTKNLHSPFNFNYYLTVARLVPYKQIDFLIKIFAHTPHHLVIVGTGSELKKLQQLATNNIHFVGQVSDSELASYYAYSRAFIQVNVEDFGIAMVEALSYGKPVIAYNQGGAKEIIQPKLNGLLIDSLNLSAFRQTINNLDRYKFDSAKIKRTAQRFDKLKWQKLLKSYISEAYAEFLSN